MKFRLVAFAMVAFACLFAIAEPVNARERAIPKTVDKFTEYMADRFSDDMPKAKVSIKGPLELQVVTPKGSEQVRLDRIWDFCERDRRHCRQQVDQFLSNMPNVILESASDPTSANIRLIVRPASYVAELRRGTTDQPDKQAIVRPVAGDLWMICVLDFKHGIETMNHAQLAQFHLSEDEAIALGLKNLAAALPPLAADTKVVKQIGLKVAYGDFYESSRMLLHESWAELSKEMGGHLVVAAPSNDLLVYGNGGGNGDRIVMEAFARDILGKTPKPISATLLRWTQTGWEVVKP